MRPQELIPQKPPFNNSQDGPGPLRKLPGPDNGKDPSRKLLQQEVTELAGLLELPRYVSRGEVLRSWALSATPLFNMTSDVKCQGSEFDKAIPHLSLIQIDVGRQITGMSSAGIPPHAHEDVLKAPQTVSCQSEGIFPNHDHKNA